MSRTTRHTGSEGLAADAGRKDRPHRGRSVSSAKQKQILSDAADLFVRNGYFATSIEQIAKSANVSKVTIYKHFRSKDQLFAEAIAQRSAAMRDLLETDIEASSLENQLMVLGKAIIDFILNPQVIQFERSVAAEAQRAPEIGLLFLDAGPKRLWALLHAKLEIASREGTLKIDDTELAAEQFFSLVRGFSSVEARFGQQPAESANRARLEGAVELFIRAYSSENPL